MINPDELEPQRTKVKPLDLSTLSIHELEDYIKNLYRHRSSGGQTSSLRGSSDVIVNWGWVAQLVRAMDS